MTQEEKAKAYDEAIERAKNHRNNDGLTLEQYKTIDIILPELIESKDERIRKEIINYFEHYPNIIAKRERKRDWIAWLEKQGEIIKEWSEMKFNNIRTELQEMVDLKQKTEQGGQNPAYKVEPKFHEGEWVVNNTTFNLCHVLKVEHGQYVCDDCSFPITKENEYHLWTIQDAKDGDVLARDIYPDGKSICLFKEFTKPFSMTLYCSMNNKGQFLPYNNSDYYDRYDVTLCPATKEQCDQLEKVMFDAGYTFDFEKKELKKVEQKPAWSEEDDKFFKAIIRDIENTQYINKDAKNDRIKWLNHLKDRVLPQLNRNRVTKTKR